MAGGSFFNKDLKRGVEPSDGDVVVYDATEGVWKPGAGGGGAWDFIEMSNSVPVSLPANGNGAVATFDPTVNIDKNGIYGAALPSWLTDALGPGQIFQVTEEGLYLAMGLGRLTTPLVDARYELHLYGTQGNLGGWDSAVGYGRASEGLTISHITPFTVGGDQPAPHGVHLTFVQMGGADPGSVDSAVLRLVKLA